MNKGKVLFIDTTHPVLQSELEKDGFQCDHFPAYGREKLKLIAGQYSGMIIRSKIKLDRDFLEYANQLQFIGRVGSGMENIDTDFAISKGIACIHAPEGNRDAVGEQAIGMLLALFNNLLIADGEVRKGLWFREENRGLELGGKTIGIIGYGNTGGAFARKLSGFGVKVLAFDKYKFNFSDDYVKESSLEELFEQTDILSFHIPLTRETTFMVDGEFIERFKKPIFVINTSRGKILRTADLVDKLKSGKVKGACLDVLEYEGLSFENLESQNLPEDFRELIGMKNVILSPHIAGWTHESNYKLAMTIVEKIRALA